MRVFRFFSLIVVLMLTASLAIGQEVVDENTYDFDDGTVEGFASITRPDTYDDEPTAVDADTTFPDAFPPPSGNYVLRSADDDENSFGLCSAVGGTPFDRTDSTFVSATLEAKIYIVSSESTTEHNFALIAIRNGSASEVENYYRFGYRNDEVYLQKFDGGFTTLGQDANLDDDHMTIPGWNTFTLEFVGQDAIHCRVNDETASFSPVTNADAGIDEAIQVGVLGFNGSSFDPILADDIYERIVTDAQSVEEWLSY